MAKASSFHERGLAAEQACAQWVLERGWILLKRRLKTPFAEIDLLASEKHSSEGALRPRDARVIWHLIEVKTVTSDAFIPDRVGYRQRGRLLRARDHLQERHSQLVSLDLMTVNEAGGIEFFADFLS